MLYSPKAEGSKIQKRENCGKKVRTVNYKLGMDIQSYVANGVDTKAS
jgi:hypothetical protein